ncbi:MAG: fibronectin type III domain-containing protein, partial [Bacteroidales bacterium]
MKRLLFFLMAIMFAISGWTQSGLFENFSSTAFPPTGWTKLTGLSSAAFNGTAPTTTTSGWLKVTTGYGISNSHPKANVYGSSCKYWLVTPSIDLGTTGNYALAFDLALTAYGSASAPNSTARPDDKFMVIVSTDNGATWQQTNATIWDNQGSVNVFDNIPNISQNINIDLSAYTGQVKIAFYVESTVNNGDNDLHIGNVEVFTCPSPKNVIVNNITTSSANVSWNLSSAIGYTIEYKPSSVSDWALATSIPAIPSNSYVITGLSSNTTYDYRIKAICTSGVDESAWNVSSFKTPCDPISAMPYTESFDTYGTGSSATSYPGCWSRNVSNYSSITPYITTTNFSSPGSMYFTAYNNTRSVAVCNQIASSIPINTLTVEFKMRYSTIYPSGIQVGIMSDPNDFSTFVPVGSPQVISATNVWEDKVVMLSDYAGTGKYIALAAIAPASQSAYAYVDDFKVDYTPSCPNVYGLNLGLVTSTSVSVNWNDDGDQGDGYNIAYATNLTGPFDPSTATIIPIQTGTTLPYIITGLTPGATVWVSVQRGCLGNWTAAQNIILPANVNALPFICDFEDPAVNSKWTLHNGALVNKWYIGAPGAFGTGNGLFISNDNGLSASYSTSLTSVVMASALVEFNNATEFELSFDWKAVGENSWDCINAYVIPFGVAIVPSTNPLDIYKVTPTYLSASSNWQNKVISLGSQYSNSIRQLVFVWKNDGSGGSNPPATIDNVELIGITCPTPSNLVVNSTTLTSADLSWNENGNASQWRVKYSKDNGATWQTQTATTNTNFILTGLDHSSSYTVNVYSLCSTTDSSSFITGTINTSCVIIDQLPWTEGFESIAVANQLPACWSSTNLGSKTLTQIINSSDGRTARTGTKSASFVYGCNDKFTTPSFQLLGGTNYAFTFWYVTDGSDGWTSLQARYENVNDASINAIIGTPVLNETNTTYQQYLAVFTAPSDGEYKFDIECQATYSPVYLTIDDIGLEISNCGIPGNVVLSNITAASVDMSWDIGTNNKWIVQYKISDDDTWTSNTILTNTYSFTGLLPQTSYDIRVASLCGTDTSIFVSNTINTLCDAISSFPWTENFDVLSSGEFPMCWHRPVIYSGYPQISISSTRVHSAPSSLEIHSATGSPTYAITPQINGDINTLRVEFWSMAESATSSGTIEVGLMSDPTDITTFESVQIIQPTTNAYTKNEVSFIGTTLTGSNNYIAFRQNTNSNWYYWIDDIVVDYIPFCEKPTQITASNITNNAANISWVSGNNNDIAWWLYYKESSELDYDSIYITASPYTLQGLNSNTIYDYYLITDCASELSEQSNVFNFTTLCDAISSFPWTDNFDTYGTGSTKYPNCWSRLNTYSSTMPYITTTNHSAPGSLYFSAGTGTYNVAIFPEIDASVSVSDLMTSFWMRKGNATSKVIIGVMADPTDITTFDSITTISPTASSVWEEMEVEFSSYNGNGRYIAFLSKYNTTTNTIYIDDVYLDYIPSCAKPISITASSTANSINVEITPAEISDTEWYVFYREAIANNWDSIYTATTVATIPNLMPQTSYEIYAKTVCFDGTKSHPTSSLNFSTRQIPIPTPYLSDFEEQNNNDWFIRNGSCVNRWMIGTPTGGTSNALFISENNADATYAIGSFSVVIAEKLFEITTADSLDLSFDITIGGESSWDYLKVFLVDKDTVFNPSIAATPFSVNSYSNEVIMVNGTNKYINLLSGTQTLTTRFVSPGLGVQKKLVFVWKNDGSGGTQPSVTIDNLSLLNVFTCFEPTSLVAEPSITTSSLTWAAGAAETHWQVRQGLTGNEVDLTVASYQANGLTPSTEYVYYVRSYYAEGQYSMWVPITFTTLAIPQRVTTIAATAIDQTIATLNGTIVVGSEAITDQGFVWRQIGSNDTTWLESTATLTDGAISLDITSLLANANYEFRAYATTQSATIFGRISTFLTLPAPPAALTSPATAIAQTVVTLNAIITEGSQPLTEKGFEWRLEGETTWTTIISTLTEDAITYDLTGLVASTDYEFRAFASSATETAYGLVQSFTTLDIVPPTVLTTQATAIEQTVATINANIILGSEEITDQGFDWRLFGETSWTTVSSTLIGEALNYNLSGLIASTDYEFRAFVTTASGSIYGEVESFVTLAIVPPTPITGIAEAFEQTIEILNGSITLGSELITDQGFEWRLLGETAWTPLTVALIDNAMNHNLTGLTANTHYEFRAYATTASGTVYGEVNSFRTLAMPPPVVTTGLPTSITQISAILNGTAVQVMAPILSQGFEWRVLGENTWTSIVTTLVADAMSHNLTGLTAYTVYEYRAFATTEEGNVYGQTQNFRTLPIPVIAITTPATDVTQVIATLNGAITLGSEVLTAQGFEWRKVGVNTWTAISLTEDVLTSNLTGLIASTNYEYRAFATTESGTVYGLTQNFTTLQIVPPTVATLASTQVGQTTATLNGTIELGSELLISQGFEWKLASATAWTQETTILTDSALTHNLTGLTPNRAYQFRAYAITQAGTTYGITQTINTLAIPQIVITNTVDAITETTATLNGVLTSGSELITTQGFEWKLSSSSTWTTISVPFIGNTITHSLLGLTPNTTYEYRAYATTPLVTVYGQTQTFTTLSVPQTVVTNSATAITSTLSTLNATITAGSETLTSQGFEWKLVNASTWTTIISTQTGNAISHNLTSLTPNTTYAYRAYATNATGTVYGQTQNFKTLAVPPTVVTNLATAITQNIATLNAAITAGSETITAQGFEYKLSNANTWTPINVIPTSNALTHNLTGLTPNTAYTFRAYATTDLGTVYGITQTFTTLAIVPPTVVTSVATAITQTVATLNGTTTAGSETITAQGFEWKLANANTWVPITVIPTNNALTYNLTGLTPNTAYTYRAYATTEAGTVYGITQTFTTLAIVPPTVVTSVATAITQTVATLNGTITSGSGAIIAQGFEYKLTNANTWTPLTTTLTGTTLTHNLTGLTANTSYDYRAFATTQSETVYGTIKNFTTLSIIPATAQTSAATAITQNTATLNGIITQGSETILTQGFAWKLTNTTNPIIITETLVGNAITHNLTGLAPNTAYEYVAYALTETGVIYGQSQTFTTLPNIEPTVVTLAATTITETNATLNGTVVEGTDPITAKGFEWRVSNTNTWIPVTVTETALTHNLIGLSPNTTYEFRAYAATSSGNVYGTTQTFTTLSILPATVITNAVTLLSATEADLRGTITTGSEAITTQGFEWKEAGESTWTITNATLNGNAITYTLSGLTPTKYYKFRAYATTASGTVYGTIQTFNTLGLNGVDGNDISIKMYPNPANIQTKLEVRGISGDVKLILSDVQGRILRTINTQAVSGVLEQTI